jgi:hypothetical protein
MGMLHAWSDTMLPETAATLCIVLHRFASPALHLEHPSTRTCSLMQLAVPSSLQESARGLQAWRAALDRGLLPDEMALQQIVASGEESFTQGRTAEELKWPEEPLNTMMVRLFSKLGAARFAKKYPAVKVSRQAPFVGLPDACA